MSQTAAVIDIGIQDNGEGIFKKIKNALNLLDERESVLELAKGKLTTVPSRHTGEGIFFTSRAFDEFWILSGEVTFSNDFGKEEDWIEESGISSAGTVVIMKLNPCADRNLKSIFDQFTSGEDDDFAFTKTVVPVELAQYGNESLMSRSQAKRVLARIEKFKTVIFNFRGVETIGQAFADEIFRVFAQNHPNIELRSINSNPDVQAMISRALATR